MSLNTTHIHPYAPVTLIEPFWNLAINTGSVFFCTGSLAKAVLLPPAFSTSTAHLNNQPIDVSKNGRKIFFYLSKSQERFYFPVQFHPLFLSGITGNKKRYRAEKREGDVPVALYYMSAYSRKEQFLYSLWHRDDRYPLHCICELQPLKN